MRTKPFDWVTERAQGPLFTILTVLLISTSIQVFDMDRALVTEAAPHGIVSYELAGTLERSEAIYQSWSEAAFSIAMLLQGFDFLYIFIYPAWLSLAASRLAGRLDGRWYRVASITAWVALSALFLDAVENYALLEQMFDGPSVYYARLAWCCALAKFAVVIFAAAFIIAATFRVTSRLANQQLRRLRRAPGAEPAESSGFFSSGSGESMMRFVTHSAIPDIVGVTALLVRLLGRLLF